MLKERARILTVAIFSLDLLLVAAAFLCAYGLRDAVHLRAYGQKDPLIEYKNEAYEMFTELMSSIKGEILHNMFRSTSNLLAFEQFLSQLPMHLLAPQLDGDQGGQQHPAGHASADG